MLGLKSDPAEKSFYLLALVRVMENEVEQDSDSITISLEAEETSGSLY